MLRLHHCEIERAVGIVSGFQKVLDRFFEGVIGVVVWRPSLDRH
jgi:hypothetical protein